ncbi:MAG: hypothetical protein LC650_02490 [Actinobacteria bacterium]|nr:hypothetical protein [Actinomycetota bacterium]
MARTYRKVLSYKEEGRSNFGKQMAAKTIRRLPSDFIIPEGGTFKRFYSSYDICDYRFNYYSLKEIEQDLEKRIIETWDRWVNRDFERMQRALRDVEERYALMMQDYKVATGEGQWR